jgi:undecaprenyl-diphosphatase
MPSFNQTLFRFIYGLSPRNFFLDGAAVFCAQYLPYLLVFGLLILVFYENGWRRKWYLFSEAAIAVILSRGLLTEVIRFFYHHPRPFDVLGFTPLVGESGSSFPSGHAAWFFALAMVIFFRNRKWGIWFFVLALMNGIARIYVGVHWPFDILGGAAIGIISAMFVHWLLRDSRGKLYGEAKEGELSSSSNL